MAEQERERICERIADVKLTMRKENRYQGGNVAFGYKKNAKGKLVKDAKQQQCIKVMREKRAAGMSLRKISALIETNYNVKVSHNAVSEIVSGKRKPNNIKLLLCCLRFIEANRRVRRNMGEKASI